jgi:hypothetical protein
MGISLILPMCFGREDNIFSHCGIPEQARDWATTIPKPLSGRIISVFLTLPTRKMLNIPEYL